MEENFGKYESMRVDTGSQGSKPDFKPPMNEIAQTSHKELLIRCCL
jgi:hypothetical protein